MYFTIHFIILSLWSIVIVAGDRCSRCALLLMPTSCFFVLSVSMFTLAMRKSNENIAYEYNEWMRHKIKGQEQIHKYRTVWLVTTLWWRRWLPSASNANHWLQFMRFILWLLLSLLIFFFFFCFYSLFFMTFFFLSILALNSIFSNIKAVNSDREQKRRTEKVNARMRGKIKFIIKNRMHRRFS